MQHITSPFRNRWSREAWPSPLETHLFNEGRNYQAYRMLGAHVTTDGVRFAVWAPNAAAVWVVGDFNGWERGTDSLALASGGVWAGTIKSARAGQLYKFAIDAQSGEQLWKTDPYGRAFELRPGDAAVIQAGPAYEWRDPDWMARRAAWDWQHAPMTIYEVHAGSWMRHPGGCPYSWRELADRLVPYVADMGYTHVELLPVMEHPLDESWGYQTTGYFAPTRRYGTPDDLRYFVDACHQAGIGVLLDWTPAHFPADAFALAGFDGTALYEHADPAEGVHQDWGTLIFNYGRHEVRSFLLSSAHYWLSEFHVDGFRVDAVASMLYRDYSRPAGAWKPNIHGGRENLEAVAFLRQLNVMVHAEFPGAVTIAEESTSWPMVSRPVDAGGLGFSMKWDMGWMNDTLAYASLDPVHRRQHHGKLTFRPLYAHSENFVLALSHDEVVHGKASLLNKMPLDGPLQFAGLRLLMAYQAMVPGKKLTFMGGEFGQRVEWRLHEELEWPLLAFPEHRGLQALARALNRLYAESPPLHELDFDPAGFRWLDCHDSDRSVISFARRDRQGRELIAVLNFTPVFRPGYRIGLSRTGRYRQALNTDWKMFGGESQPEDGNIASMPENWLGHPFSVATDLAPLSGILLERVEL